MNTNTKITVLGSGSWATAIVKILSQNVSNLGWWIREPEIREHLLNFGHNPEYLSSVQFDAGCFHVYENVEKAVEDAEVVLLCIPAAFLDSAIGGLAQQCFAGKVIASAIKGVVPETNTIVADYLAERFGVEAPQIVIVTGPSHAEEVAQEKLTYLTVASQNPENAQLLASVFNCRYIKTSLSDDIYGTEYAPILKNIMAMAAGMCHGIGFGDNFQAVLISNAIAEMEVFLQAVHAAPRQITASVYLGDLLVTAYSQFSRNRLFGNMIGKGYSVKAAQHEMNMIAEGYYAAKCIHLMNQELKAELPVCEAVYEVLYNNQSPSKVMKALADKFR